MFEAPATEQHVSGGSGLVSIIALCSGKDGLGEILVQTMQAVKVCHCCSLILLLQNCYLLSYVKASQEKQFSQWATSISLKATFVFVVWGFNLSLKKDLYKYCLLTVMFIAS